MKLVQQAAASPPPAPVVRPLSALDGALSHLLHDRAVAEMVLQRAKSNLEHFLTATQIVIDEANGRPVDRRSFPPEVQRCLKLIGNRDLRGPQLGGAQTPQVQRAD